MSELLRVRSMTKRYGDVTVLDGVDFDVRQGELHALLGANGAGKSTLCKMISGLTDISGGQMHLAGKRFLPANKQSAEANGIQIIQQELNLIPTLNVAENLFLGNLPSIAGFIQKQRLHQDARRALDRLQLDSIPTDTLVDRLGVGRRQMVEIAAALACQCKVLILDEPTAALSGSEAELLFRQLELLRERGVGMIYISHRLDEIKRIADRVTVLRDGRNVGTVDIDSISTDQMVQMMSGEGAVDKTFAGESQPLGNRSSGDTATETSALVVDSISCGMVQEVSFQVAAGEIFGVTGLVGSGRTELLRAIFGADVAESGTVSVAGRSARRFHHPSQAVAAGLAMVTEDRKHNGLMLQQSIRSNTSLAAMSKRFSRLGVIRHQTESLEANRMCRSMETRCADVEQIVQTLSGGNQQKVAIAKWLTRGADVFLFDEPTRGIDIGARRRIYRLVHELAAEGKGMVIVSSDLDELFEICDRIAVMSAGRLIDTFSRGKWSEESILQASFAGHREMIDE